MGDNENTDNSSLGIFNINENKKLLKEEIYYNKKEKSKKIKIISELLIDICEQGKNNKDDKLLFIKPFISKKIPSTSIFDYIERLSKYSKISEEILILVLINIDRICRKHRINLNYYIIHKLILASFISTIKLYEDHYYSITYYAKIGGVSKKEIIKLEYEFLNLIDFKLFVQSELFDKYNHYINSLEKLDDDDFDLYTDL